MGRGQGWGETADAAPFPRRHCAKKKNFSTNVTKALVCASRPLPGEGPGVGEKQPTQPPTYLRQSSPPSLRQPSPPWGGARGGRKQPTQPPHGDIAPRKKIFNKCNKSTSFCVYTVKEKRKILSDQKHNMMKRLFLLAILTLAALTVHAQHFEWVRTYTGPDLNGSETNNIVGSFVDTDGNFYFLGEFSPSATLCGVRLLPEEVVSEQYRSVVIAKLSPSGQLLWYKAIYSPQISSHAYSLCQMGDTAFMVMVGFMMSHNFNSFLYYLDTLLTSSNVGYLQSYDSTASPMTNGFITFRLDGSVAALPNSIS